MAAVKHPKELQIQVSKPALLSGPTGTFVPALADFAGGDIGAILYFQLCFLSKETPYSLEIDVDVSVELKEPNDDGNDAPSKLGNPSVENGCRKTTRISFSRLQRQFPFVTRRTIIDTLKTLESKSMIQVERGRRVNVYIPIGDPMELASLLVEQDYLLDAYKSRYVVLSPIALKIGLKAAIVLQQIHLRTHASNSSTFVIRSFDEWHIQTFPFWSLATVKRVFAKLKVHELIIVKPQRRKDDGFVNSYRVNYVALANLLGIPVPELANQFKDGPDISGCGDKSWAGWTNPVTLKKQVENQKPSVHETP